MHGLTARSLARIGLVAALVAGPVRAQAADGAVSLPLKAPAGAHPLVADFVEICSAGITDTLKGGEVATARGYKVTQDDSGLGTALVAALGAFSAVKTLDSGHAMITINRAPFPDLAATSCMVTTQDVDLEDVDPTVLSAVPGVRGGGGVIAAMMPKAGFFSLVDTENQVVTITSTPIGGRGIVLTMSRAVRLDPATGRPFTDPKPQ